MADIEKAKSSLALVNTPGLEPDKMADYYTNWKTQYDKDLEISNYTAPKVTAQTLAEYLTTDREVKVIIDIAAGTGIAGEELQKYGFRIIDAVDPSQGMLDMAKQKNVYRNLFCDFVTESPLNICNDTYDALTMSGAMVKSHVDCSAFPELIRIVKPGGYIVIVTRFRNLETEGKHGDGYSTKMDQLENEGKWKKVKVEKFDNYISGIPGVIIVYQKI